MKKSLIAGLSLLLCSCATTQYTVTTPPSVDAPKQILVIGQSCTQNALYQTVIDLKDNEVVILEYINGYLRTVIRTQMKANPDDYKGRAVQATDAPRPEADDKKPDDKNEQ